MQQARPAFIEWLARINQFIDLEEAKNKVVGAAARAVAHGFLMVMALVCGGALLLGAAVTWWSLSGLKPLHTLTMVMQRLVAGDYAVSIPSRGEKNEVGAMADTVQVFKDNALRARETEQELMETQGRRASEDERVRINAQQVAASEAAALVVGSIGAALAKLAEKDLTYRMSSDLPEAYRKLQTDFNAAIDQLEAVMRSVNGSAKAIQSGTQEISTASDDLSRRTEQQAASLEETAAALDEITATVKKSAEGATHARQVVASADDDAKKSAVVVREAVAAMDAIAKSSQQVSQIISVIDEIAFQTNLLALNAGVEAARAGDAGRGFAVVASEVRALAQRSAEAAKEIKGLISASSIQVTTGVKLVAETGKSLESIMVQVTEINEVMSGIEAGAKEQAIGLTEVNTAINQMDQVTQQNAAMVEQSTAASHSLSQETAQLAGLIGQFKVGGASDDASMRQQLQKVAPHAFRQPVKAPGLKAEAKLARSAPKAKAANSWEEF
jgi:methyl-accepting chemotaxis protein